MSYHKIVAALDAAYAARQELDKHCDRDIVNYEPLITFWADRLPEAEHALAVWACSHNIPLKHERSLYKDGTQIRTIKCGLVAVIQFPREPQPQPVTADDGCSCCDVQGVPV